MRAAPARRTMWACAVNRKCFAALAAFRNCLAAHIRRSAGAPCASVGANPGGPLSPPMPQGFVDHEAMARRHAFAHIAWIAMTSKISLQASLDFCIGRGN